MDLFTIYQFQSSLSTTTKIARMSALKLGHCQTVTSLFTSVHFLMAGGLTLGTVTAVGHHVFATKFNGQAVNSTDQQERYSTVVTGLAFLTRAFLTASAGLAYTQLLWYILRSKTFSLAGADAIFSVVKDLWSFFNWELWSNGSSLVVMAIVVW